MTVEKTSAGPPGIRVPGGYRWIRPLGQGSFGTVHLCVQESLDRPVVLKILREDPTRDPALFESLVHEAKVTSSLTHPHLVVVLDHGQEPGFPWIVFEYLAGGDVKSRLATGPLPFEEACLITAQIASALDAAHQVGVIHRDVKPGNILRGEANVHKLTDFGIARWARAAEVPAEAAVVGTPGYMAPELTLGGTPNVASDVYALGVTFHEMVTGRQPFCGASVTGILEAQHREVVRLEIPGIDPGDLELVLRRALSPDPEARHPTIGDFWADFEAALAELEKPVRGLLPPRLIPIAAPRPPRPASRRFPALRETEKIDVSQVTPALGDLGVDVPFVPGSRPRPGGPMAWLGCVAAVLLMIVCLVSLLT